MPTHEFSLSLPLHTTYAKSELSRARKDCSLSYCQLTDATDALVLSVVVFGIINPGRFFIELEQTIRFSRVVVDQSDL